MEKLDKVLEISIHAPARGATLADNVTGNSIVFQSTLPRGERRFTVHRLWFNRCEFQSTLPRGERLDKRYSAYSVGIISIHAPARGATFFYYSITFQKIYFNPRSREGSDCVPSVTLASSSNFNPRSREGSDELSMHDYIALSIISIHAPARGATEKERADQTENLISIHAPARGATKHLQNESPHTIISIHAPARGATCR